MNQATKRKAPASNLSHRTVNCTESSGDRIVFANNGANSTALPSSLKRPNSISLKVANDMQVSNDLESFYVTPFTPDQNEEEVKQYVIEISNAQPSMVKVTKLVPRGKNAEDLSFVSFKVSVCKTVSSVVGDPWYWPEGITVRTFEPTTKNGSAARLPVSK